MTKTTTELRCGWCRRKMPQAAGVGRPREYCRRSCRQRAYEARRHADELGLSEHELIITKDALEQLLDQVYVLQAAVEDVDRDLKVSDDPAEAKRALEWLLVAARPLADTQFL